MSMCACPVTVQSEGRFAPPASSPSRRSRRSASITTSPAERSSDRIERSPSSSLCASSVLGVPVLISRVAKSQVRAKRSAIGSRSWSSACSRRPGLLSFQRSCSSWCSHQNMDAPRGRLQAASTSSSTSRPPIRPSSAWWWYGSNPWNGTPSLQSRASVPLEKCRWTVASSEASGITPVSLNQQVDQTGPHLKPRSTGVNRRRAASSGRM